MGLWRQDPRFGPLPPWFGRRLDRVLADFQKPDKVDLLVGYDDARGLAWFSEADERGRSGLRIRDPSDQADEQEAVDLAGWLQEQVFPETRAAWGEARPACPGHTHPAVADLIDGEAWWICPNDGHRLARIGTA